MRFSLAQNVEPHTKRRCQLTPAYIFISAMPAEKLFLPKKVIAAFSVPMQTLSAPPSNSKHEKIEMKYHFQAKIWKFYGKAYPWYFVSVPEVQAVKIRELTSGIRRGFNSVRVEAAIGSSKWKTSIFIYSKDGSYVLPIKKDLKSKT